MENHQKVPSIDCAGREMQAAGVLKSTRVSQGDCWRTDTTWSEVEQWKTMVVVCVDAAKLALVALLLLLHVSP